MFAMTTLIKSNKVEGEAHSTIEMSAFVNTVKKSVFTQ